MLNIGIINFNYGNIKSVLQVLKNLSLNLKIIIIKDPYDLLFIDKLILPGQGNIKNFINYLIKYDLFNSLESFTKVKQIMGICLGKHVFFNSSEEENSFGLNILNGCIKKFPQNKFFKIPHIGWNKVFFNKKHFLFNQIKNFKNYYFSHSYYLIPSFKDFNYIYGVTNYILNFSSIFIKNNLFLVQFHPENSYLWGMKLFYNFILWDL